MALTTKANVLTIAPSLSTASDDLWNLMLADVENAISASVFGVKAEVAARNWVAHNMTILADTSAVNTSGPVTKERVGDVMREYAKINKLDKSDADYSRTKYGRTFLTIRSSIIPAFGVVIPGV